MHDERRIIIMRTVAYSSWSGALLLSVLRISGVVEAIKWGGAATIMLIGIGVMSGLSVSKMRLTNDIISAFKIGVQAAEGREIARRQAWERRIMAELQKSKNHDKL